MLLEQAAKHQQRGLIQRVLSTEVDPDKFANRLAVVDYVLDPFIGEPEALLRDVHSKHLLWVDRQAPSALDLRVTQLNPGHQSEPRRYRVDLIKEAIAPRTQGQQS